jgi:hypothetical protein
MLFSLRNALFLQATGSCPSQIDEVIRGWDRYVDQVKLLPDDNNIYNCWKGYTGGEDSRII